MLGWGSAWLNMVYCLRREYLNTEIICRQESVKGGDIYIYKEKLWQYFDAESTTVMLYKFQVYTVTKNVPEA